MHKQEVRFNFVSTSNDTQANSPPLVPMSMSVRSPLHQSHANTASDHSDSESETEKVVASTKLLNLNEAVVEVDVESLNPLSPEVISKQATINIGKLSSVTPPAQGRECQKKREAL